MGRLKDGILGGFSGKAGSVVGYRLKGVDYIRGLPRLRSKSKAISAAEQANREKFAEAQSWIKPLKEFVRIGFKNYRPTFEGFVAAKSYFMKHAMKGSYPELTIDPALMLVSYGDLPGCIEARAVCEEPGTLTFYWTSEEITKLSGSQDLVMVLAYDTVSKAASFNTAAAHRNDRKAVLGKFDLRFGKEVDVYISFTSEDRQEISKSRYLGKVELRLK